MVHSHLSATEEANLSWVSYHLRQLKSHSDSPHAARNWLRFNRSQWVPAAVALRCLTADKLLRHTPLMSFISLQPRLAWRDFSACHWFIFTTHHTCPLALVDWSQIVPPVVNHRDISQWDKRGQAWRARYPQVWLRSTFQNVHTCQLLWHSAAPRKTSADHSLSPFLFLGPMQREKEIAPVSVAQISNFLPMQCVSSILS